jgi:hypothetical protein
MKRLLDLLGWAGILLIVAVLSAALGEFWFGLWMDKGWPGATGLLGKFLHADGEHAYDAMQYEMTIWCLFVVTALFAFGLRLRQTRRKRK